MPAARKRKGQRRAYTDPHEALDRFQKPQVQQRFRKALDRWGKKTKPLVDAVRSAERLDETDFAIRINTKA